MQRQHTDDKMNGYFANGIIRQFLLLVEMHFKTQHQVQYYAARLNRSPKTLANVFAQYGCRSPLQIIHDRIIREAKQLFIGTDMSAKEVAYKLGFEDAAHFVRFFKNGTGQNVSEYKRSIRDDLAYGRVMGLQGEMMWSNKAAE